ncbi:MAG: glycosyltransferase family 39 protein, partial [Clostridia bacterium]|nr:glycosyltransferase family 39 protein [Clostridia bacterium]
AKGFWSRKASIFIGVLFLLTPIFWFDSSVWGQIESVLLVCLVLSFLTLYRKQYLPATIFYVLAVLIKPQGLILAPIFAFSVLSSKRPKTIFLCAASGIILFLFCIIPFSPAWQEYPGASAFLDTLNPAWIIQKYMNTMASYPYFSVNAFNLYGLLGLNWIPLNSMNPIFASMLNVLILLLGVLGAFFLFFKIKHPASRLFLSAYFILGFFYTFAFKMHERYIVLPLLFLLVEFVISKNKKILAVFSGLSIVGFLNLYYILQLVLTTNAVPDYRLVFPLSLCEVLLFFWSIWVIYKDYIAVSKTTPEKGKTPFLFPLLQKKLSSLIKVKAVLPNKNLTRLDALLLTGIVLIYSFFAFVNLGDAKAPQSYYRPKTEQESFMITLKEPMMLSEINYYCGISDVDKNPGIQFSYSDDGELWTPLPSVSCVFDSVFHWEAEFVDPVYVKFLRGTPQSTDYTLYEIGFRDWEGNLAAIEGIDGDNPTLSHMADEQELVTNQPSYRNSTYFDEIYHPRTAYEHLHGLPYYETTHPPLGKLMMAVGIAIFGMSPFGWRFAGTLMGVLMLPISYLLLKRLFRQTRYSVMGTLLFAFDFMHFSLTRMGTIDSYPVFFILSMYYSMYRYGELALDWSRNLTPARNKELLFLFLSGLFMGLGCASKWTAVYASVGLAIEFFFILFMVYRNLPSGEKQRFLPYSLTTCGWCLLFFLLIPATVYILSYFPISMVDGYGNVFEAMWNNQQYMLSYHSELNGTHPYSSPWYTWP